MSQKNDEIFPPYQDDEGAGGEGGEGGQAGGQAGGHIEFHEFIKTGDQRDDLLSGNKKSHLLAIHKTWHESLVKKQKESRERREAVRRGEVSVSDYRRGTADRSYPAHPVLGPAVQFSGIDRQVNPLPDESQPDTNNDKKEALEYQYNLTHKPEMAMRFNPPKPSPT